VSAAAQAFHGRALGVAVRQSDSRELARLLGVGLSGVQKALQSLEADGLVGGRLLGRTRTTGWSRATSPTRRGANSCAA
jgi:DNA-binding transcriptional MocR family regulator